MTRYCDICYEKLRRRGPALAQDGASLSFYVCPLCGAIYALFVAPRLPGGHALFRHVGDGRWEKVGVVEEVMVA
jgi:hypothetical protein